MRRFITTPAGDFPVLLHPLLGDHAAERHARGLLHALQAPWSWTVCQLIRRGTNAKENIFY